MESCDPFATDITVGQALQNAKVLILTSILVEAAMRRYASFTNLFKTAEDQNKIFREKTLATKTGSMKVGR